MARGHFIALEGIDGSGTTSQARALKAALEARGHTVLHTREPSTGSIGRLIRQHLGQTAADLDPRAMALLFAADRLDHVAQEIEPALGAGQVVLSDRYLMSSWVYQGLKCDLAWLRTINAAAPWPDLTLVINVPVSIAQDRLRQRLNQGEAVAEIYDAASVQQRIAASYQRLIGDPDLTGVVGIDGDRPMAEVTEALMEHCRQAGL